jgi:hypothetical protein
LGEGLFFGFLDNEANIEIMALGFVLIGQRGFYNFGLVLGLAIYFVGVKAYFRVL